MARLTENQWVEYFGFQRFPFDRPEAGNEEFARPEFLASCFVEPNSFERVLGQSDAPVTSLLFADRGTGKTACRVMVDYYCQRGEVNRDRTQLLGQSSYVLSVPHIHLDAVIHQARQETSSIHIPNIQVEHHTTEILKRSVPALVGLVAKESVLTAKIKNIALSDQQDLTWFIEKYSHYLTATQAEFLHDLTLYAPVEKRWSANSPGQIDSSTEEQSWKTALAQKRSQVSSLEHLTQWSRLIHRIGIQATYILIDGVDEFEESAADPAIAVEAIRPLLASLRLMDGTPHLALKFFLPAHIEDLVRADDAIRRDRGFIFETINWSDDDLIEILRKRLGALKREDDLKEDRSRLEEGFDALCVPELRGQIESDLTQWAKGNPRHLMVLCGLMVSAHCDGEITDQDDPYQLNRADFQTSLEQFAARIDRSKQSVAINQRQNVNDLIAQGESEQIEFKSSLRWDIKTNKVNKYLQQGIVKAIAGMLNVEGGTLLIGVADDGTILGIEKDFQTLKKKNADGFQLLLIDIVENSLGIDCMPHLQILFESVGEKLVCVVVIEKSLEPVYCMGRHTTEFWVRTGNSTRQLDIKAAMKYIQTHWKKIK